MSIFDQHRMFVLDWLRANGIRNPMYSTALAPLGMGIVDLMVAFEGQFECELPDIETSKLPDVTAFLNYVGKTVKF